MKKSTYYTGVAIWLISLILLAFVFQVSKEALLYVYIIGQGLMISFMPGIYKSKCKTAHKS